MMSLPMPNKDYKVIARCHTYNHERYIELALNGFVMQETTFPYCAVVIDDCSTDKNQEVISQYVKSKCGEAIEQGETDNFRWMIGHPAGNEQCTLVVLLLKYNHYQKGLVMKPYYEAWQNACKYEALCEGDDYWTDPLKLQKQVDILEADETLMGCVTNCSVVDMKGAVLEEKRIQPVVRDNKQGRYSLRDFFDQGHQYPTLSAVYRNTHREEVSEKCQTMRNPYMGDWTMWIALLCFGDFYYLDEPTCAYRINPTSLTHDQSKMNARRLGQAKFNFKLNLAIASVLPEEYEDIIKDFRENRGYLWYNLAHAYRKNHQYLQMLWSFFRGMIVNPKYCMSKLMELISRL